MEMGKAMGFLEYNRESVEHINPIIRIENWEEFYVQQNKNKRQEQAARCMECGIPFCHTGSIFGGMTSGCPVNNLIPEWNDLIYNNKWEMAYKRLEKTNNFPEFTGRVCPAPCEGACTAGCHSEAVTIKNNELDIIEFAFENGWVKPFVPEKKSGKKVAIIGAGPAGLACADTLNRYGHTISVFEKEPRAGGLLMYGIPNMKLDKKIINRRINIMKESGIKFIFGANVGMDYSVEELKNNFDAVVMAIGTGNARDLEVKGRELNGIYMALDYLKNSTKEVLDEAESDKIISAKGKKVVVIGGGDTGTDCVATAIRQGCESVVQFEIMPELQEKRQDENPWPEWPKVKKIDYGQEESIELFGKDPREYLVMTKEFVGDNNNLKWINTINVEWVESKNGRFVPKEIEGSEKQWEADLVLLALGFVGPEDSITKQLSISHDHRTNIKTREKSYMTVQNGIFVAGDARRGQSLVVWAIKEGREVAKECNDFLERQANN
jgi:glutamate synthase (NADPH/NADH) small chain